MKSKNTAANTKSNGLSFNWPETGKLDIQFNGNRSVMLKFAPSKSAIFKAIKKGIFSPTKAPK